MNIDLDGDGVLLYSIFNKCQNFSTEYSDHFVFNDLDQSSPILIDGFDVNEDKIDLSATGLGYNDLIININQDRTTVTNEDGDLMITLSQIEAMTENQFIFQG